MLRFQEITVTSSGNTGCGCFGNATLFQGLLNGICCFPQIPFNRPWNNVALPKQPQPVLPDEVTVISWKRSIYWATPKKATTIVNCSFSSCAFVSKRMSTECLAGRMPLPLKPVKDKSYF